MRDGILRILHLEDDPLDRELVGGWLEDGGFACEIKHVQTAAEFQAALGTAVDVILSDYKLPEFDGLSALALAREFLPDVPFILFSGTIGEEFAIESLKQGATDYVLKQRPQRLAPAIRHALEGAEERAKMKQAEIRLREQAALLDKAQDAIMVCDLEERITFWNGSAERIYGWPATEVIGQNAARLLSNGDSPKVREAIKTVSERGEWLGELSQVRRDGTPVVVESRWTLVRDNEGKASARLIINTDVTERKQLEAQFLRAQRMESLGALAGGIAHDLNNILAPILMSVELLGEEVPSEDRKKMLVTVRACAQRGSEMVRQILSFARGVSGQAGVLQVKTLVAEMARLAKDTFPRSVRIQLKMAPDLPPILGNATQLHQVLLNLCVNARDAMPEGGNLELEAKQVVLDQHMIRGEAKPVSGNYVAMSVSDTGCGMAPEVLAKVFEPFFTTKSEGKGTGLGLSTVVGIARSHGGFVEVSSEVGKGTTFKVYLPVAPAGNLPETKEKAAPPPMGRGERILVVDDEIAILEITRESLEAFNYRVLMAENGAEAVAIYKRHQGEIRAVITDMMMPVMDGPTSIQALREIDPKIKIIGISGLGSEAALTQAGSLEVQRFLKKPYATATLLTILRQVLDEDN
ncbi:MAG TPA: response regulator [Candidatus Acidoferrum sp.]|jgi:two-component system cell cycle sensor histidine kinase/response regulator CckA|nr:response regulator [Candidatus Acidoferrum sp.]